jgi:hypothetical protein
MMESTNTVSRDSAIGPVISAGLDIMYSFTTEKELAAVSPKEIERLRVPSLEALSPAAPPVRA